MDAIVIFTTGGTIDKVYFDAKSAYEVGASTVGDILKEANVTQPYRIERILQKDSLEMTDADRRMVADRVAAERSRHIVVTHGTDTMVETARTLSAVSGKTIVLTGAIAPARFKESDAAFNVGCAVAAVQVLPEGVYLTMNGQIFDPRHVRKNRDRNRFETLSD